MTLPVIRAARMPPRVIRPGKRTDAYSGGNRRIATMPQRSPPKDRMNYGGFRVSSMARVPPAITVSRPSMTTFRGVVRLLPRFPYIS